MQLDNTRIAVRERGLGEILDLSLHVWRRYAAPLLVTFLIGALPLAVINHLLIGWIMDVEYRAAYFYVDDAYAIARFVWNMSLLVAIEAPLASIFATAYLGQSVFVDRPPLREILRDVLKMFPRVAWCQLLVRGVLPAWLLLLAVERGSDFQVGLEGFLLWLLAMVVIGLRLFRPFINEIVLLERNPLLKTKQSPVTVGRRSAQLHGPSAGDLLGRGLTTCFVALALTMAFFGSQLFLTGVFLNAWRPGPAMLTYGLPLAMWLVAAYLTVVRFLSYLDLRIRQEGWEVELRMRAEATRILSKSI